ncbi:hypothetical protein G7Y89_g2098 [Cudoniella acicularis]|uniref:glutathione synthase n=1 Tax=Cudoniella acicularis TaxID=354080 RepID=A0A8H4RTY3_9HELO|nr:hypothetical protein G7Y89_g2098 [Cudoniella acicularis]
MAPSRAPEKDYPPELTGTESEQLLATIKDWSIAHGLTVRPPVSLVSAEADPHGVLATTAPLTLFPSPFPRVCFEQAKSIQKAYNQLYAAISQDEDFLKGIVQDIMLTRSRILEVDEFIAELWQVHLKVKEEGYVQNLSLGLFRSDYMVHQTSEDEVPVVKQVEFNTIASSFGGLSSQTSKLHKYLSQTEYPLLSNPISTQEIDLPSNSSTSSLATGIHAAFNAYTKQQQETLHTPCVIFLVQSPERNIFDQRHLEYALQSSHPTIPPTRPNDNSSTTSQATPHKPSKQP